MKRRAASGGCAKRRKAPELNDEQQRFVDAPVDESLALRAGAGSGKTHTLVARICRLEAHGATVLVFSHANKTVDEIKERLKSRGCHATVMTMHAYCLSRMHAAKLRVPPCLDEAMEAAAAAFEAGIVQCHESHVEVDEANDMGTDQNRVVLAMLAQGKYVTLIGDAQQSIYGFQGSSPLHLRSFERLIPPEARFQLRTNYRCSNSLLVDLANSIASDDIRAGAAVHMLARDDARPGARPPLLPYADEREMLAAVLRWTRELPANESCMILAHTNDALGCAHAHLMAHGIDAVLHSSQRSQEFRRIPVQLRRAGVVQLLTFHGAKGGEADHVLILTGQDRGDSVESDGADGSESRRMLYVACTRARATLRILYAAGRSGQPCRWLSAAWAHLDARRAARYASAVDRPRRAPEAIGVTTLLQKNGSDGLHAYFSSAPPGSARTQYCEKILDLDDSDGPGQPLQPQAPKAYQLGLEMFMGKLFELHAAMAFDALGTRALARGLADSACRLYVNRDVLEFSREVQGRAWWRERGGQVLLHLRDALENPDHDGFAFAEVYATLPDTKRLRSYFVSAFQKLAWKFSGFPDLKTRFRELVMAAANRVDCEEDSYCPPPFEVFFRAWMPYTDSGSASEDWQDADQQRLRRTHAEAFQATCRVERGSCEGADMCLFAALACHWSEDLQLRQSPERWQPLLHLAHPEGSPVRISVEEMKLSAEAAAQIQQDARAICELLGRPLGLEQCNSVSFACRAEHGDEALSARGGVLGRADVVFASGPLEIKALKQDLSADHGAQTLWYCCATRSQNAYLWDVYRRRLLIWTSPEPDGFLSACLLAHLRRNPPPGGAAVIWPQRVCCESRSHCAG